MDNGGILIIQLALVAIQLAFVLGVWLINRERSRMLHENHPAVTDVEIDSGELPITIPRNAKWFKQLKNQLRNQTTIDVQYRNGLLTVFTMEGPITYSVDGWILRRLKSIPYGDLFVFLEQELGHKPNGIKIRKSSTHRTPEWFRKRKRMSQKPQYGSGWDEDDDNQ